MKKLINIYIMIITAIIFFLVYHNEGNYSFSAALSNIDEMAELHDNEVLNVAFFNVDGEEIKMITEEIGKYLGDKKIEASVSYRSDEESGKMIMRTYLYYFKEDTRNHLAINHNNISFTDKNEKRFYSTNNETNSIKLFDNDVAKRENYVLEFHPWYQISDVYKNKKEQSIVINFMANSADTLYQNLDTYLKEHTDLNGRYQKAISESTWQEAIEDDIEAMKLSMIVLGFIVFSLYCCLIVKQNKTIMIMRLNGLSSRNIVNRLYLKCLLGNFLCFGLVMAVLYALKIGIPDDTAYRFNQTMKAISVSFCFMMIALYLLIFIYVSKTASLKHFKMVKDIRPLLMVEFLLKIGICIYLVIPVLTVVNETSNLLSSFWPYVMNKDKIAEMYSVSIRNTNIDKANEESRNVFEYLTSIDGELISFMPYMNQMPFDDETDIEPIPWVYANSKYLENYKLYDRKGTGLIHRNSKMELR